ncbi:unnamed protein product [Musa acuminata subsp. malaccensis]|uniref:(wild Malaysian banana) hypothetical protein n=1 Tax=Musa acuminata subsp. malaccensis TaxID=214687 RepID=A0A8D7AT42_MUSAM|nr:unnamed protein product [Musa acuminata subsp. malaccensis]
MDSVGERDVSEVQRRKKRFYRHTSQQIQELEAMFKVCPHPDEKQRMKLSRDLGLEPRQIKFWFQNRRTLMKATFPFPFFSMILQSDNCSLRAENDKIRCENITMEEALKRAVCLSCGAGPPPDNPFFDEQKLRMENTRLKEEVDRLSEIASRYLGRPITQLPSSQRLSVSQSEVSVGTYYNPGISSSLDLGLLCQSSSSVLSNPSPTTISDLEKPIMMDMASAALEEVVKLIQTNEPLWLKSASMGTEVLQSETYERIFQRPSQQQFKFSDTRTEASRGSALVIMDAATLVDMFMDSSKWMELFPTIVSNSRTIDVLASGTSGTRSGSLLLMYEELQVLSPVVPTRHFCFLRYCQQIDPCLWVIADVSVNYPMDSRHLPSPLSCKLPSGCLIEAMPNGYSKVSWVEHVQFQEKNTIHRLFRDLVNSGTSFGANRWLTTLQRMSQRFACLMSAGLSTRDIAGAVPSVEAKKSMMKLAHRLVMDFCASFSASVGNKWTMLSGINDDLRVTLHRTDSSLPHGVVLSAATSIWLPLPRDRVFSFLKDEQNRPQWDVFSIGNNLQKVAHITNGSDQGNAISILRGLNYTHNMLILQESCTDASGSVVVYSPIDLPAMNTIMSGEDPSYIHILPSGFTILPDGRFGVGGGASTSSCPTGRPSGSLVTVAFQMLMSSSPGAKLSFESIATVNNSISNTIHQIKAALSCPSV